ncbi:NAD(P)-binding protein [Xylaria sp. FL0933]|nr:NAD(P)-binding protein [Xylaria sp. FL0933]
MAAYDRTTEGRDLVHKFSSRVRGKTFLLTGPTPGGIGAETVISLAAESPAMLILLGRSEAKAQPTIDAIKAMNASINVKFIEVDLASLRSVRTAAKAILDDSTVTKIDVVFNNAGVMATPQTLTEDKLDLQLAVNHLSHFVLTNMIMPKVVSAGPGSRIVVVTSSAHRYTGVRFEDPNWTEPGSYREIGSYGQSKSANILFAVGLNQRLRTKGIHAYAPTPGIVPTGLLHHVNALGARGSEILEEAAWKVNGMSMSASGDFEPVKTLQQGCASLIRAALDPDIVHENGVYISDANVTTDPEVVKRWATDVDVAEKCWKLSEKLVGQKFDL